MKTKNTYPLTPNAHTLAPRAAGMTLIEVLFTIGVILVAFVGIFSLFVVSISVVTTAKARAGALALASERIEQIRALPYEEVGTAGGIPSGSLAQTETLSLNNLSYTRRTLIQYVDDPADGVGAADQTGISADYKHVKVEVVWSYKDSQREFSSVTNIVPKGIESLSGGGTLRIQVFDALAAPIQDASVRIINTAGTPSIDVTTYTDGTGSVVFPGTPAQSGYEVVVSKSGYSSAKTYAATVSNPNPNPGHLSVAQSQTTSASFFIDRVASLSVRTWKPIEQETWSDPLDDDLGLTSMSSTTVSGGTLTLQSGEISGSARATSTAPAYLSSWVSASFSSNTPGGTGAIVRVYSVANGVYTLLPDGVLPANSGGFTSSPINLSAVSTSTYPELALSASFTSPDGSTLPSLEQWTITYDKGPTPLPNIAFTMQGAKTIGTDAGGANIYKFSQSLTSGSSAAFASTTIEWDTYGISVNGAAEGYDISEACAPLPLSVLPNGSVGLDLYFLAHTNNSVRITVKDATSGVPLSGASVHLTKIGFDNTKNTSACGQAFWSDIGAESYNANISKAGYQTISNFLVDVSGASSATVSLTPL